MDGPANLTFPRLVLVRVHANVQWQWRVGSGGNYVAMCDPLKITLQAPTYSDLMEDIGNSLDALLKDLMESNELDEFMREHGWTMSAIPTRPKDMRFDVPFSVMPLAPAGTNDSQRSVYQ
jgi:hypothetical protein